MIGKTIFLFCKSGQGLFKRFSNTVFDILIDYLKPSSWFKLGKVQKVSVAKSIKDVLLGCIIFIFVALSKYTLKRVL